MGVVWPGFVSRMERGVLTSVGVVQPTPITRAYRVRLTYRDGGVPKVHVLEPKLVRRPEEPDVEIPHTYEHSTPGNERPCLYHPSSREWTPEMPLAMAIMPWLLTWLVDYEIWLATGLWLGGGIPHRTGTERSDALRQDEDAA